MNEQILPHDNWANCYDYVYENSYGPYYKSFTDQTIAIIHGVLKSGAILDFGAGTGRLTLPLTEKGYTVHSADPSTPMLDVLVTKMNASGRTPSTYVCPIDGYNGPKGDLALAAFTVMNYITAETIMENSIRNISEHLNSGGYFFFDLAGPAYFTGHYSGLVNKPNLNRRISITNTASQHIFKYEEETTCSGNGFDCSYTDSFCLRQWLRTEIDDMLHKYGLKFVQAFDELNATGAQYLLYRKEY
jgi:SAM-dependent methyltransferase